MDHKSMRSWRGKSDGTLPTFLRNTTTLWLKVVSNTHCQSYLTLSTSLPLIGASSLKLTHPPSADVCCAIQTWPRLLGDAAASWRPSDVTVSFGRRLRQFSAGVLETATKITVSLCLKTLAGLSFLSCWWSQARPRSFPPIPMFHWLQT